MKLKRTSVPNSISVLLAPAAIVALLLMFFLLLCTSFVLQPGIAVQPPVSSFLLPPQQTPLVVSITPPPFPAIFFDNQKSNLKAFGAWLESYPHHKTRPSIIIKADKHSPVGLVTEVLNEALKHGFSTILATQKK